MSKFELDEEELEIIRWWIDKTNIAWGFDLDHKEILDLPEIEENTWQNALDRMFIGFCSGIHRVVPLRILFLLMRLKAVELNFFQNLFPLSIH